MRLRTISRNAFLCSAVFLAAHASLGEAKPSAVNYDESKAGVLGKDYTIPDPLVFADGRKVENAEDWAERRSEMLEIFEREVYGRMPPRPESMTFELVAEKTTEDRFAVERRYRQWFRADKAGPCIDWVVFVPRFAKKPCPVILHLNYNGNDVIASGRTNHFLLPLGEFAARGYAFMSAHYTQITADGPGRGGEPFSGVFELWGKRDPARTDSTGSIMAWAWGLCRGLDLAENVEEIDGGRGVVVGSSRLGKAALLAAAFDERFKVCVANQTGAIGTQLMKRDFGENLSTQRRMFPWWYCPGVWKWTGREREMPFDQHMLLACVAPRALLVEGFDTLWFDPRGEWLSVKAASPAWEFLSGRGVGLDDWPEPYDGCAVDPPLGYVRRTEGHGLSSYDWHWALDFADKALGCARDFSIADFGAEDGAAATEAFARAIASCEAAGGGRVVVPKGTWRTGAVFFRPGVNLHLEKGATILGVDDAEGYPVRETRIEGETCVYYPALVNADRCDGFTVTGEGVIDGHGLPTWRKFWELRKTNPRMLNKDPSLVRPRLLYVSNSKNVDVSGVTFKNSKFWTTHFYRCENVRVHDCEIVAEVIDGVRGPSTDAIDIDVCRGFTVSNVVMDVNDDAVVVKGGKGLEANNYAKFPGNGPSEGIVVEDCLFKSVCHSCLTLGSECPAVSNVVMRGCRLEGPGNFVNVKMRDDTPQDYSGILVESCRGNCRKLFNCRAWKQFSTVKNEEESPVSRLADFTMRGNKVVARERPDSFEDRAFIKFSNCRIEDGVMPFSWPEPTQTMKPWVYNWWMGSAVDKAGLELQCRELADKGFGGFHVIPIYGAKGGYEKNWKPLLSPQWIEAWNLAAGLASYNGLGVDLTMGSGWCFGGPWIPEDLAASSKVKVMRAGPGGEGYMVDPFNPESMKAHVAAFAALFGKGGSAERPRAFYHDSYEYYGAKPREGQDVEASQIATFKVWADWCRENGYATRNQAHGSPANWLDLYALADIPETEMFWQHRNILVAKFASSAAHVKGTTLVAAETCTWVDEHFCERPREIKEFIDRLFLSGVNHVFYHGMCYSPTDAEWPGWCFYASLEMNPRNPIWREVGALNAYVTRCQSLFQTWTCDNDLLVLWDTEALRKKDAKWQPNSGKWFKKSTTGRLAKKLFDNGYAFDYVSPRLLKSVDRGGRYVETVDAEKGERPRKAKPMPFNAANGLMATRWKTRDGRQAYFVVNQGGKAREVQSRIPFVVMDPLSGEVAETTKWTLEQGHSAFFVGETFNVAEPSATSGEFRVVAGPWTVTPVCGGPAMPDSRTIDALAGWETWDEAFCGTMRYETSFDCEAGNCAAIDLGDVREIARVRLNGRDLGVRFMPPYRFDIPSGLAKDKGNRLEVEVTNLGANRIRDLDRRKVNWKYFCDRNVYGTNYKPLDASVWPVRESGILGPVHLVGH